MSQDSRIPYTYLIGWKNHNKWYYGVRFGKNCNPSELWKTYFTSSKYVNEFRKEHGEPDVVEVRRTFDSWERARNWEHEVLCKLHKSDPFGKQSKWLNRGTKHAIYNEFPPKNNHWNTLSEERKLEIGKALGSYNKTIIRREQQRMHGKSRKYPFFETGEQIRKRQLENNSFKGKKHKEETLKFISDFHKNRIRSTKELEIQSEHGKIVSSLYASCLFCKRSFNKGNFHHHKMSRSYNHHFI